MAIKGISGDVRQRRRRRLRRTSAAAGSRPRVAVDVDVADAAEDPGVAQAGAQKNPARGSQSRCTGP